MTYEDFEAYAVGLAIALGIYFSISTVIPFLFRKIFGSKPVRQVAKSKVAAILSSAVIAKPVFAFAFREVPGEGAMAAFEAAKAEGKGIPVLIAGGSESRQSLADSAQDRKTTEELLQRATTKFDPYLYRSKPRMPKQWVDAGLLADDGHPFLVKAHAGGFKPLVSLAFIPAQSSADIPAFLRLGGWNAVPEADIMVALFRKWQSDYGAEIVAISLDAIDVRVTRKPETREEALVLAREHLKFCPTGATLAESAAELMATRWWHFYWD